jgi:hypothetical protein
MLAFRFEYPFFEGESRFVRDMGYVCAVAQITV